MKEIQFEHLGPIKDLFLYFLIAAGAIFLLVVFFTLFYSWKYKQKKGDREEPEQLHGHRRLEFSLIGIAFALVGVFFYLTVSAMNRIQDIPEGAKPNLLITGHQWWWEAKYADGGLVTANEVHVPVGKELLVQFNSEDVIHSWWIPSLGRKMDLVPGVNNYMKLKVDEAGEYWGSCSEFCGAQHGWMRIRLIAQAPEDFQKWKAKQLASKKPLKNALFERGQKLFASKTCINCHAISPTADEPNLGPNLANFSSREYFLSNIKLNNKENLAHWLKHPGRVKSSARMPDMLLNDDEIKALMFYLENLE
ncbi:MAG: cytochrome c oxidase subunit II [Salinimicrobium sp.]